MIEAATESGFRDKDGCTVVDAQVRAWKELRRVDFKWTKLQGGGHPSANGYPAWILYTKKADVAVDYWLGVIRFSDDDILRTGHGESPCWIFDPEYEAVFEENCLTEIADFMEQRARPTPPATARLRFIREPRRKGRKTDVWEIRKTTHGCTEGSVSWYSPWRRYVLSGTFGGDFSVPELRRIIAFLSRKRAEAKGSRRAVP